MAQRGVSALGLVLLVVLAACSGRPAAPPSAPPAAGSSASGPAPGGASPVAAAPPASASAASRDSPAGAAPARAAEPLALQIPYQAIGIGVTPLWTAVEGGLFQPYGLDVTTDFISLSPQLVASMLSGQVTFAIAGQDAVISADLNGGDIVILASGVEKLVFSIWGLPELTGMGDLKGKKIGVSRLGATTDFVARYLLQQARLQPDSDVTILQIGGQAELLAAVQSGAIDAGVFAPPTTLKAQQLGLKMLADMADHDLLFYTSPLVGKRSWIAAHPAETLDVVRGYVAGVAAVHRDKELALQALGKYTQTADREVLEDSYQALVRVLPRAPIPKVEAMQTGLSQSEAPGARTADPASFIDPSFVAQLQASGFIESLYR
ncbi:MAG TPA: ABC transporter substrate-binding protein [Chloroflexota bacterium]|nr:ABC transporter substrate-binding protein [Chloroflexota bacterium]